MAAILRTTLPSAFSWNKKKFGNVGCKMAVNLFSGYTGHCCPEWNYLYLDLNVINSLKPNLRYNWFRQWVPSRSKPLLHKPIDVDQYLCRYTAPWPELRSNVVYEGAWRGLSLVTSRDFSINMLYPEQVTPASWFYIELCMVFSTLVCR